MNLPWPMAGTDGWLFELFLSIFGVDFGFEFLLR